MSEISLSERDCLIRRLQHGEKHNRKVTDRKFYRRLLNHIASLEAQLAARNQAAEAMGVLERLVERTWGFVSIQKLPDKRRKKRWQITTDGEDFKNYSSLIEAVLKAGGADAQA